MNKTEAEAVIAELKNIIKEAIAVLKGEKSERQTVH